LAYQATGDWPACNLQRATGSLETKSLTTICLLNMIASKGGDTMACGVKGCGATKAAPKKDSKKEAPKKATKKK
jgi:hypothetical protein